jgi:hypothetical protein
MIQFADEPKLIGTYTNLRPLYDVAVPLKGEPLASCTFDSLTIPEVLAEMKSRQDRYNQQEVEDKFVPNVWLNVGYWVCPPTITQGPLSHPHLIPPIEPDLGQLVSNPDFGKIVAYYQIKTGMYTP